MSFADSTADGVHLALCVLGTFFNQFGWLVGPFQMDKTTPALFVHQLTSFTL